MDRSNNPVIVMNHSDKRSYKRSKNTNSSNSNHNRRGGRQGGGFKPSTLNPDLLVRKATMLEEEKFVPTRKITDLPVNQGLIDKLVNKGYEVPTEIQDKSLEALLDGRDFLGIAQTGTGKTAAFLVPIINDLMRTRRKSSAIIVVPTRELALQVEVEFKSITKGLGLYSTPLIGGTNINRDRANTQRKPHVIIGTPGRILDLVSRQWLDLRSFETLVLDEFDRMLDMGFQKDVMRIINTVGHRKQSMLFSATLDKKQQPLIDEILTDPVVVKVSTGTTTGENIDQEVIRIGADQNKFDVLQDLLALDEIEKVLIFEETKHKVNKLSKMLNQKGIRSDEIHGNKTQSARQKALNNFKTGKVNVLVATDVAARGIDVSDITHVINYQVPQSFDTYIHRIGRTGRAGKVGKAYTLLGG
jgi:ATP-dependent RNA helicase RhlE